jgi:hypothetical protein
LKKDEQRKRPIKLVGKSAFHANFMMRRLKMEWSVVGNKG